MKTTKHKGITYQLDESKFKPAYIKYDKKMFEEEIHPVLVGLGFEVANLEHTWYFITNDITQHDGAHHRNKQK